MQILKRIVSASMALLMGMLVLEVQPANAEELENVDSIVINEEGYVTNDAILEDDASSISELNLEDFGINSAVYASRPSKFDISTDSTTAKYFPPVGSQGGIGSCVEWATTYYQFTYEVNKMRGISTGTNKSNIYSPSFVYNYINCGVNKATSISEAYNILKKHGAMKLADCPYDADNYSYEWSDNEEKLIEALNYRPVASQICVESTSSPNFEAVKSMIANGHIAVIGTNTNGFKWGKTSNGEWCVVRGSETPAGGHVMAVVGYDDNIKITADGETLTGAFKLVNSWGTDWKNNGFTWVAYDALNSTSTHENAWNYAEKRKPIFDVNPGFNFLSVQECDVNFAGIVSLKSENKWKLTYYGGKGSTANTIKWRSLLSFNDSNYVACKMAFDFFEIGDIFNIDDCLTSFWTFKVNGSSSYKTDNITYKIVDNLNNRIAPNYGMSGSLNSSVNFQHSIYVQLAKGRVRYYDNVPITTEDSEAVMEYIVGNRVFSNLQKKLADYNSDGEVDIIDVIAMNSDISAAKGASYQISDYIEEWDCSLEDIIQEEYNMTADDFLINHYTELESNDLLSVCS